MKIDIKGNKIKIANTKLVDIDTILEFEKSNNQFVHQYPRNRHIELLHDHDCLHLSIFRIDNNALIGHIIALGRDDKSKAFEFRRLTIHEKGNGFGKEAFLQNQKLKFQTVY